MARPPLQLVLMGPADRMFLIRLTMQAVRRLAGAEVRFLVYDWGDAVGMPSDIVLPGPVDRVDWRAHMPQGPTPLVQQDREHLIHIAQAFNRRRPIPQRTAIAWWLRHFPDSYPSRALMRQVTAHEWRQLQKINCLMDASRLLGHTPFLFLEAEAIPERPFFDLLPGAYLAGPGRSDRFAPGAAGETMPDADIVLPLAAKRHQRLDHDHCSMVYTGVMGFGADPQRREAFLEDWWLTAETCREWNREQTAVTRLLQQAGIQDFVADIDRSLTLAGTTVTIRLVPGAVYHHIVLPQDDVTRLPDALVYRWFGAAQRPISFPFRYRHFRRHRRSGPFY